MNRSPNSDRTAVKAASLTATTVTIVGGVVMASGTPAHAAAYEVTTLLDVTDNGDGEVSLREAINEANAQPGPDVITFEDGLTGTGTLDIRLPISDDLSIIGPGQSSLSLTTLDGDVLYLYDGAEVSLSGFTIDSSVRDGIIVDGAALTMNDVTVSNSGGRGVGFELGSANNSLTMQNSTVSGSALGGVSAAEMVDVEIVGSLVSDNGEEGIVVRGASGNVTIRDVTAENNAIGIRTEFVSGALDIGQSTVSSSFYGIVASSSGTVSISTSTITDAFAGVYLNSTGRVTISDSEVVDTQFGVGMLSVDSAKLDRATISGSGASAIMARGLADFALTSSTITGGTGSESPVIDVVAGGGPSLDPVDDGSLVVAHSTISGNAASEIIRSADAAIVVDHSIVAGNDGAPVAASASTVEVTNSLVPVGAALGASNIETDDPALAALADNGGQTRTMVPEVGSPAIDAGDIATAPFLPLQSLDQRGGSRLDGDAIDIGSVETESPDPEPQPVALIEPIEPARLVDTRPTGTTIDGLFDKGGRPASGSTVKVKVAGRGGVPADAVAAALNVTAINPSVNGFATVHPCLDDAPNASSLNFTAQVTVSNEVIAQLSDAGEVCVFIQGDVHVAIDVTGVVRPESAYTAVEPARIVDTRATGETVDGLLQGGGPKQEIVVQVAGRAGVPIDAKAAVVNLAAVASATNGFVTAHPCLDDVPNASSLNYTSGKNRANEIVAPLNADGEMCLAITGTTNILVDVAGYVPEDPTYVAIEPARFADTRPTGETIDGDVAAGGKLVADSELEVPVAGRGDVPDAAVAVIANVTVAGAEATGFVTTHACVDPRPLASSLNYVAGVNGASEVLISLDGSGSMCLYTSAGTHLIVDVVGYLLEPVVPV